MYFGLKSPESSVSGKRSLLVSSHLDDASSGCESNDEEAENPAAKFVVFEMKFLRSIMFLGIGL